MSIVTVGNSKGGVGKTRIATHIAYLGLTEGAETVLLDTDQTGSASSWKRLRSEAEIEPPIPCFAVPKKPIAELRAMSPKYDLIVVDIGANHFLTMMECASVSDLVLVPCGDDQQEMEETLKVFSALQEKGEREGRTIRAAIVLTRVSHLPNHRATRDMRELFGSLGLRVLAQTLPQRTAWKATGKTGKALHELRGDDRSKAAETEMTALYEEVKTLIGMTDEEWAATQPQDTSEQEAL